MDDEILKRIDAEIADAEAEATALKASTAARLAEIRQRVTGLRRARAALTKASTPRAPSSQTPGRAKAGPSAVTKVRETLAGKGTATQADLTKETGLNSGQVSAAMLDLEAEGVVRRTGVKVGRSAEFEMVGAA